MNKKRLIASFLCACMVGSISFTASAEDILTEEVNTVTGEVNTDYYYEYLSSKTVFTVKKLKEIEAELG